MVAPSSLELGPAGSALGLGTAADFEAEGGAGAARRRPVPLARAVRWSIGRRRRRTAVAAPPSLLQDEVFRTFLLSRLTSQTAQGALLYAFLLVVADRTDSAFFNSLFVVCSILPSIAFGLPAGIVIDELPRRPMLVGLNSLRFVFALSLTLREPSLAGVFAATLGLWTIHQFHSPSESAALSALVPRERYASAQALSNLALTLAQLLGLVILAPLLLKTASPRALYAVCAALFFVAAGLATLLPRLDDHIGRSGDAGRRVRRLRAALLDGWRGTRADPVTYRALVDDVLIGIGMSALVVIMPLYLRKVLNTSAENTVFVFAPAALGLVLGLRYAPRVGHAVGEQRLASAGLVGFSVCVGSLGYVVALRGVLEDDLGVPLDRMADLAGVPTLVLITMLVSIPAGFASALVSVAARSLLLARTPASRRGQVIATQSLIGNIGALVPTLLAGVAADLFGVEPIAVAIAVLLPTLALAARVARRPVAVASASPSV